MKRFAGADLQALEVNVVPPVQVEIFPGEIVTDDPDQFDRAEKAGGHRRVAGRSTQQARILRVRSFDGIQRGRADNENAHVEKILNVAKRRLKVACRFIGGRMRRENSSREATAENFSRPSGALPLLRFNPQLKLRTIIVRPFGT